MKKIMMTLIIIGILLATAILHDIRTAKAYKTSTYIPMTAFTSKDQWTENRTNRIIELLEKIEENTRK